MQELDSYDKQNLTPSIEKLFHYLFLHTKKDLRVMVYAKDSIDSPIAFDHIYRSPERITISPTLYTRLDDCHGAGNCCRVPFSLLYTVFDHKRIVEYDDAKIRSQFGDLSANRFNENRSHLLSSLEELYTTIEVLGEGISWSTKVFVKRNRDEFYMSGR